MKFKDFEIRRCAGANAEYAEYELVKWYKTPSGTRCYVLAFIKWNPHEPTWEFESVGMRFIEDYENGLCEYIKKFFDMRYWSNEQR